jgi:hypothetical protein
MSHTVSLKLTARPPYAKLLAGVSLADVGCEEPEPMPDAPWPEGTRHYFRAGLSARSTELHYKADDGTMSVRIFSLAAAEDVDLALRLVRAAARVGGAARVEDEEAGELSLDELGYTLDAAWADSQAESGARALAVLIREGHGPVEVRGPIRSLHVGPRLLTELEAAGPANGFHRRLVERLRCLQWIDPKRYRAAGIFEADTPRAGTIRFAVWDGQPILFPPVEFALVDQQPTGRPFLIPAAEVPGLAGPRWRWLDERQGVVEGFGDDWPTLVARARILEINFSKRDLN